VLPSLDSFCDRLSASALSRAIQSSDWVIPTGQTVHTLAVAAVMSSILAIVFAGRWIAYVRRHR
jgi:hypothetical protein